MLTFGTRYAHSAHSLLHTGSCEKVGGKCAEGQLGSAGDKVISASLQFSTAALATTPPPGHHSTGSDARGGCHTPVPALGGRSCICSCTHTFGCWCFLLRLLIVDNNLGCFRKAEVSSIVVDILHSTFASVLDNVTFINICGE